MKKDKLHEETLRLLVFVIGIFSICILLLTFKLKVNAESPSTTFPYVVPSYQDLNSSIPSDIYLQADSLVRQSYNLSDDDTVLWFIDTYDTVVDELGDYGQNSITFLINPSTRGYTESFDFSSSTVVVNCQSGGTIEFRWTGSVRGPYGFGGGSKSLLGTYTTTSISHGSITRLYPFYMSGPDVLGYPLQDGGNDPIAIIFTNYVQVLPDEFQTGHAQEPSFDSDTIIDSSLHPVTLPTFPTFNTYNITNYISPTIDNSTVETLLESLIDVVIYNVNYVVSNVVNTFDTLWDNLQSILGYISDLMSYLMYRLINTIKQVADNLYQNFKDLFEPVLNSLANMINIFNVLFNLGLKDGSFDIPTFIHSLFIPSTDDLDTIVGGLGEVFVLSDSLDTIEDLFSIIFDTLNDNPVYSIHIQGFSFHGVSVPPMEISFDWYLPYKATGDIFISAFLIVGYFYWLWCRIAGFFHGVSPDAVGVEDKTVHVVGFGRSLEGK